MECFYDEVNKRLVYFKQELATPVYWDNYWKKARIETFFAHPPKHRFLIWATKKYLPLHSKILEGGCGMGGTVFALQKAGFDIYGIDFADKTIRLIQQNWPHLHVMHGDVRSLPFDDNFFDGYWSLGIIEHFYHGYDEIMHEMYRVLKPGGYLFLSFPAMTTLRKRKAVNKRYQALDENNMNLNQFYQFALEPEHVRRHFETNGFQQIKKYGQYSLVGLEKECNAFKPVAKWMSKLPGGMWVKLNMLCDIFLGDFSGHTCLLILKKKSMVNV